MREQLVQDTYAALYLPAEHCLELMTLTLEREGQAILSSEIQCCTCVFVQRLPQTCCSQLSLCMHQLWYTEIFVRLTATCSNAVDTANMLFLSPERSTFLSKLLVEAAAAVSNNLEYKQDGHSTSTEMACGGMRRAGTSVCSSCPLSTAVGVPKQPLCWPSWHEQDSALFCRLLTGGKVCSQTALIMCRPVFHGSATDVLLPSLLGAHNLCTFLLVHGIVNTLSV